MKQIGNRNPLGQTAVLVIDCKLKFLLNIQETECLISVLEFRRMQLVDIKLSAC